DVRPCQVAWRYSNAVVVSAPPKAASGSKNGALASRDGAALSPATMAAAAARPAPDDTPTRPGSASGLRSRPGMTAPAPAGRALTIDDITIRGSLMVMRMIWSRLTVSGSPLAANSAAAIRPSDIFAGPIEAAIAAAPSNTATRTSMTAKGKARRASGKLRRPAADRVAAVIDRTAQRRRLVWLRARRHRCPDRDARPAPPR